MAQKAKGKQISWSILGGGTKMLAGAIVNLKRTKVKKTAQKMF